MTHWHVHHSRKAVKILGADRLDQLRVNGHNGGENAIIFSIGLCAKLLELPRVEVVVGLVCMTGLGSEYEVWGIDGNAKSLDVASENINSLGFLLLFIIRISTEIH